MAEIQRYLDGCALGSFMGAIDFTCKNYENVIEFLIGVAQCYARIVALVRIIFVSMSSVRSLKLSQ